jgi:hypothetical protein
MTETREPGSTIVPLLTQIMRDVGAVTKKDENTQQGFLFRGIDSVVNAVSPALIEHGVTVIPTLHTVDYHDYTSRGGALMTSCRVIVEYTFRAPDGDSVSATVAGEAADSGDKATPKAMSVAFRTALLQSLTLPTHDRDPDAETYEKGPGKVPMMTQQQISNISGLLSDLGIVDDDPRTAFFSEVLGRQTQGGDMTEEEARRIEDALAAQVSLRENSKGGAKPDA